MKDITLFITEKPSLGRIVASAIGGAKDQRTHSICNDNCVVVYAEGHIYEYLKPEEYNPDFKVWKWANLPLPIEKLKNKASERTQYRVDVIKKFLGIAKRVIHVGDPDREGQRIVDTILEENGWEGPVERLWNTDQSERGMKKTMDQFKKGFPSNSDPLYVNMSQAALARAELDWILGMNLSRGIGCRLNEAGIRRTVSYGRFQSTVLAIIVNRELERESFVAKTFYTPNAVIDGVETSFIHDPKTFADGYDTEDYLIDKNIAESICDLVKGKQGKVEDYKRVKRSEAPPLPYDISKLIQEANKRFKISAKETNDIAQSLYDKGITTYPRVDCRYLPEEHYQDAKNILESLKGLPGSDTADVKIKGKCFNTKKTDEAAHHAIVPTGDSWSKLSGKELLIFQLIAEAYILQFHPDREYESQSLVVVFDGPPQTKWKANGIKNISLGWRAIVSQSDDEKEDDGEIPTFAKGANVVCDTAYLHEGKTQKPPAFTEGSIMLAMENVDKFEPNPEYKKLLKEAKGIGTGATRGGILELLQKREYITIAKNSVIAPTSYGIDIISYIPEELHSPALTAIMEDDLNEIMKGKLDKDTMIKKVKESLPHYLDLIKKVEIKLDPSVSTKCPICKKSFAVRLLSKKSGRHFWKCQGESCGEFFDDNKGKLVIPQICPHCEKNGVRRYEAKSKKGFFYWFCKDCKNNFADDNAKPGKMFVPPKKEPCPTCDKNVVRRESSKKPGAFFWVCEGDCGFFKDDNERVGKNFNDPSNYTNEACPTCDKRVIRLESSKNPGYFFWKCQGDCGGFKDENGKLGKNFNDYSDYEQSPCPVCKGVAIRAKSQKGTWYWRCTKDGKNHGPFSDNDGSIGNAFGEFDNSGKEEADCPHCKKLKAVKIQSKNKPGNWFWACKECGLMSDIFGKPGDLFGKAKKGSSKKASAPKRKKK